MSSPARLKSQMPAKGVAAAVLFLIAIMAFYVQLSPLRAPSVTYAWFYDLETGQLFSHSDAELPPIKQGKAVKAAVFSCGKCGDRALEFIGWLEKYTDEAKQAQQTLSLQGNETQQRPEPGAVGPSQLAARVQRGHLIAPSPKGNSAADIQWIAMDTPAAFDVMAVVSQQCHDKDAPAVACAAR